MNLSPRPRTISLILAGVTLIARASALVESPRGSMNSSRSCSPKWMGFSFLAIASLL
jgi:hypothetical protein